MFRAFERFANSAVALAALLPVVCLASACAARPPLAQTGPPPLQAPLLREELGHEDLGLVSAADSRAADAGAQILKQGGSATDAAIATMLALTVVEPQSSGIGGGGFLVTGDAAGKVETIDGRETAPAAANPRWFYNGGTLMSYREIIPGGRPVGVPGNVRLAAMAHARHGKLAWKALFQPAIRLARDGFVISPRLNSSLAMFKDTAGFDPAARAMFFGADGAALAAGASVRNPALAAFLQRVAAKGADSFYKGENADAIARTVSTSPQGPSPMTMADIAAYRAKERPPVCGRYRVWKICGIGPPSSGVVIVLETLGALERFDLKAMGSASPKAWHLIAEAERLAFADRDKYLGDPDFVAVPVAGLIAPEYLAARSALISETATIASVTAGLPAGAPTIYASAAPIEEHGTSHFAAVDRWGNAASYTSTIESGFGSGLMANGYFLNNELTDFNLMPERGGKPTANRVESGKRPRSSMSPVLVYGPDGHLRIAAGAAGGLTIPVQVIRLLIGTLDWGMTARDAITMGVVMPGPDRLVVEAGTPLEAMVPALIALGHINVTAMPMRLKANAIEWTATLNGGHWTGAADPRSEGTSVSP